MEVGDTKFVPDDEKYINCASFPAASTMDLKCKDAYGQHWGYAGTWEHPENLGRDEHCFWDNGAYAKCVLEKPTGDPATCCTTGTSGSSTRACDPRYIESRFTSSACDSYWKTKCDSTNMGLDSACRKWAEDNTTDPYVLRETGQYCNGRMGTSFCRKWCLDHDGTCDTAVRNFCTGKDNSDRLCACVNSLVKDIYFPKCADVECKNFGYQTQNMIDTACPSRVDCSITQNLQTLDGRVQLTDSVINQNCGSVGDSNRDINIDENPQGDVSDIEHAFRNLDFGNLDWRQKSMVGIMFVLVLIALILPVIVLVLLKRKKSRGNRGNNWLI